jgi:hypothetical protein
MSALYRPCRTGFSHETLKVLHGKLIKLKTSKSPFTRKVKDEAVTRGLRPELSPRPILWMPDLIPLEIAASELASASLLASQILALVQNN